jgi:sodium transport system ATP-binding protein
MEILFSRFQMNNLRNTLGSKMSTGMRQKVSIVRALIHDPPVLIFDEATSGLDLLVSREVFRTIEQLRDEGKCIIYSSHIMSEVERLCDFVAIMHRGEIISQGTLPELSERHGISDFEELFYQLVATTEDKWESLAEV